MKCFTHPRGVGEEDRCRGEADHEGDAASQLRVVGLVLHVSALQEHGLAGFERQRHLLLLGGVAGQLKHELAGRITGSLKRGYM